MACYLNSRNRLTLFICNCFQRYSMFVFERNVLKKNSCYFHFNMHGQDLQDKHRPKQHFPHFSPSLFFLSRLLSIFLPHTHSFHPKVHSHPFTSKWNQGTPYLDPLYYLSLLIKRCGPLFEHNWNVPNKDTLCLINLIEIYQENFENRIIKRRQYIFLSNL